MIYIAIRSTKAASRRRWRTTILFLALSTAALAACGEAPEGESVVTPEQPDGGPVVSVAYQSGGHVRVIHRNGTPSVVLHNATYPRFSPDGTQVAAVRGDDVVVVPAAGGEARVVARGDQPRAVAWSDSAERLFFTDGDRIQVVGAQGGEVRTVWRGDAVLELDAGPDDRLVGTVKGFGYDIYLFDPGGGKPRKLASGCSASFSPDGSLVSNLLDGHRSMQLVPARPGVEGRTIKAPEGIRYDNHMWTNHPDWIAGELEGSQRDVLMINSRDGRVVRLTDDGDAGRPDVYVHRG